MSLIEEFDKLPGHSDLVFKHSRHFNPEGHRFLAERIGEFLREKNLLVP